VFRTTFILPMTISLAAAGPDGLLPETDDSGTGRWLARPWFAWPGAALAALALGAWTTGSGQAAASGD
jgi:hypothetical protein